MWRLCVIAMVGCGRFGFDAVGTDGDAVQASADARRSFGTPVAHTELETPDEERDPSLTADLLEIYFTRHNIGGLDDIYVATRPSADVPFGAPAPVPMLATGTGEDTPAVSLDGLTMYVGIGSSLATLYVLTRPDRASSWSAPVLVTELMGTLVRPGTLTGDGLTLYLQQGTTGFIDLYVSTRPTLASTWNPPVPLAELNTTDDDADAGTDPIGLEIYFTHGVIGSLDIFHAHRDAVGMPFVGVAVVDELSSPGDDSDAWISPSGDRMFYSSARDGMRTIYETVLQ